MKLSRRDMLKMMGLTTAGAFLAACGAQTPEVPEEVTAVPEGEGEAEPGPAAPSGDEVIDVEVSLWDIQYSFPEGEEPDEVAQMVRDRFNVNLVPVNVGWGDADEKYNTWAASGQLPDIIGAIAMPGTGRYYQWINDGVVRPLPDVSDYLNIWQLMESPDVTAFAVDGENYFLPRFIYPDTAWWGMDRGLIVRRDWMQQLGIEDPETEEDYINMLLAFVNEDPDGNGQADTAGFTPHETWILWSQGWPGFGYTDTRWVKDSDGMYRQAVSSETTFYMMQFFKRMYQAGGLDPDFATLESGQSIEKFGSGKTGMLGRQVTPKHLRNVMNSWVALQPDLDFMESIKLLHGPTVDGNYVRFAEKSYWSETYIEAGVDDAKLERILALYDWLYSEEGMYTMQWGMEGKDYVVENDGSITLLTPVDEESGLHTDTSELYPFTYAMNYLAAWSGDVLQYIDPAIPEEIRELTAVERDLRVEEWQDPEINYAVQAINVPEKEEMAAVAFGDDWVRFISDESSTDDRELYQQMLENWNANGYEAAVEAITAEAEAQGIG